jgi:hypothetical protein
MEKSPKYSIMILIGIIIVLFTCIFIPIGYYQNIPSLFIDFPCPEDPYFNIHDKKVIVCISLFPREAISGGGIYYEDTTNNDTFIIELPETGNSSILLNEMEKRNKVIVIREENIILLNNIKYAPGEGYYRNYYYLQWNPWIWHTLEINVENKGISDQNGNALYIFGEVKEGWIVSPIGLVILFIGVCLLLIGLRKRKTAQPALAADRQGADCESRKPA